MKMKQLFIPSVLLLLLFFSFCNRENQRQIEEVESLEKVLQGTEEVFNQIDTGKVFEYRRQLITDIETIQKYNGDTVDKKTAVKISNFNSLRKAFNRFHAQYPDLKKEISFSKQQLNHLKQDIKNDNIPSDKFSEYYEAELDAVVQLNSAVERSVNGVKLVSAEYEKMKPEIDDFIAGLDTSVHKSATDKDTP